jgi:hypothetical protein
VVAPPEAAAAAAGDVAAGALADELELADELHAARARTAAARAAPVSLLGLTWSPLTDSRSSSLTLMLTTDY